MTMKRTLKKAAATALVLAGLTNVGCTLEEVARLSGSTSTSTSEGDAFLSAWEELLISSFDEGSSGSSQHQTSSSSSSQSSSGHSSNYDYRYEIIPAANNMGMNFNVTSW